MPVRGRWSWFSRGAGRRRAERPLGVDGAGVSSGPPGAAPGAMPGLPPPHEIARLRRQLERAVEERRPDRVREAMGEVVTVLVRSLPLALPAPEGPRPAASPPDRPRPWADLAAATPQPRASLSPREELAKIIREWEALSPSLSMELARAHRPPERLMERLRRSAGAMPDHPSWSALPWTDAAEETPAKRERRF